MRYLIACVAILALSGCDRDEHFAGNGVSSGAADSGVVQTPAPVKSETLKITYSKADPFAAQPEKKEATPGKMDHSGHDMKDMQGMNKKAKPGQEKKSDHEEHQHK